MYSHHLLFFLQGQLPNCLPGKHQDPPGARHLGRPDCHRHRSWWEDQIGWPGQEVISTVTSSQKPNPLGWHFFQAMSLPWWDGTQAAQEVLPCQLPPGVPDWLCVGEHGQQILHTLVFLAQEKHVNISNNVRFSSFSLLTGISPIWMTVGWACATPGRQSSTESTLKRWLMSAFIACESNPVKEQGCQVFERWYTIATWVSQPNIN